MVAQCFIISFRQLIVSDPVVVVVGHVALQQCTKLDVGVLIKCLDSREILFHLSRSIEDTRKPSTH